MPRAATKTSPRTLGERLRQARGSRTLTDVIIEIGRQLPPQFWVTTETIRRLETGFTSEEKANPVLIATLARIYGVKVSDLSPLAVEAINDLRDLLELGKRWSRGCAGQMLEQAAKAS